MASTSKSSSIPKVRHDGQNVKKIRTLLGIKQEKLATDLKMTQSQLSRLELVNEIKDDVMEKIAEKLGTTPEAIRNFNEEAAITGNYISNTNHDNTVNAVVYNNNNNPAEEIRGLYEEILKLEREKIVLLEQRIKDLEAMVNRA